METLGRPIYEIVRGRILQRPFWRSSKRPHGRAVVLQGCAYRLLAKNSKYCVIVANTPEHISSIQKSPIVGEVRRSRSVPRVAKVQTLLRPLANRLDCRIAS